MKHVFTRYDGIKMIVDASAVSEFEAESEESELTIIHFQDLTQVLVKHDQDYVNRMLNELN